MGEDFDIQTLLNYKPPRFVCKRCLAILFDSPYSFRTRRAVCPACGVEYVPGFGFDDPRDVDRYLQSGRCAIQFHDSIAHAKRLAGIARRFERSVAGEQLAPPAIKFLYDALDAAQVFVHFSSWGTDLVMLGALKLLAARLPVRGVLSNPTDNVAKEAELARTETRFWDVKVFERSEAIYRDAPHSKLVVIDGLLMFHGSANLTSTSWRGIAKRHNQVRVETAVAKVAIEHNRYISVPFAADATHDPIEMSNIPF